MANDARFIAPGGDIDPKHAAQRDVYAATPAAAVPSPAYRLAQRYIELVRAKNFAEMPNLFTEDAITFPPLRRKPVVGRAEITDFYLNVIGKRAPNAMAVSIFGEGNECFMELANEYEIEGQ